MTTPYQAAEQVGGRQAGDRAPAWQRHPWRLVVGIALSAAVTGVAALGATGWWVRSQSEGRVLAVEQAPTNDVALVLGAGLRADGSPTPFLAARLDRASELFRSGRAKVLLVSGDNRTPDYDEPTAMQDYLVAHGVPQSRIVRDFAGRDSYDSCTRARRIFGIDRLTVVSQAYHLPRAVAICRAVGVDAVGVGDWTMSQGAYRPTWQWGERRETAANLKAAWDVLVRRDPVLGPPESTVRDALTRANAGD